MERRSFMKFFVVGAAAALAAGPSLALTSVAPLDAPLAPAPAPEAAVATQEDIDRAQVEKTYWYYRRRVWRPRWRRRYWRRHYRPRFRRRRRYYYYY
ncbi:hypothetical protein FM996_20185 [Methylosinus sporium]|uniref:Twin-arginine translocation (Tat) n=1 Tax=Methylosinus sporium TaxID=428 RepID=A0A549SDC3_METSR|nr:MULTISPECIES: hypothetical protein [Methylosinus]MBU3889636.1 twin-arginine translocation (Tat) [Methylosinus sp. KRF6]TRL25523.1 hypothetical protein FM996_20185 [Methylosinus sporium]